ncbi:Hypothetical predicted protein [Drosophila guanche]|uniref:Uncharacterized protein n=1 Tax=Drosophila guanche TaxID=7266 RepID=A0A3B0JLH4_DROGU|nr:Hypothetical predicted protein [Drosophila guanche]
MTGVEKDPENTAATEAAGAGGGITGILVVTTELIQGVPVYSREDSREAGTYSGQFAFFYPHDGSPPSMLLLGENSYLNVTEHQDEEHYLKNFV